MMSSAPVAAVPTISDDVRLAIDAACARIAPAWPLDRAIAVNPYWGWVESPITDVAAEIGALAGAPFHMPRAWYREQWRAGELTEAHLRRGLDASGARCTYSDIVKALESDSPVLPRHPLVSDALDLMRDDRRETTWHAMVLDQIGRSCEAYFDSAQAAWGADRSEGLYALWRSLARTDAAPRLQLGLRGAKLAVDELPEGALEVIAEALDTLALPKSARAPYLTALLLSVGGWGAACAHRRWDARLAGRDDDTIVELLAARIAWELVLYRTAAFTDIAGRWTRARRAWLDGAADVAQQQAVDWALLRAAELRFSDPLAQRLAAVDPFVVVRSGASALATVRAQAVFCIDVRSEPLRRALEREYAEARTLGFAGFFGLPLAYAPLVGRPRPQLPGLLSASLIAEDVGPEREASTMRERARRAALQSWRQFAEGVPSAFPYVEAMGFGAGLHLIRASFAPDEHRGDPLRAGHDATDAVLAPALTTHADGRPLDDDARAALAAGALKGMSLTEGFARLVAFIGHGATVMNNPQAAALACGACGGQSGEVNARALAALLNDRAVQERLVSHGITIPRETRFVGGVHDTTTDDVVMYPEPMLLATHADDLAELRAAFARSSRRNRRARAESLGLEVTNDRVLGETMRERGRDWSEVRPEWGLARNAAFIAAPRARTRRIDLQGRAFLHEYDWQRDAGFAALELILTAPMVVANWINLQYYGSTVDPERFGSGDKTLHNVVGGTLGVYEGAGGDLRIGLAKQSVHDGTDWVHEPLRLSVYVEAPAYAIDDVIAKHPTVRALVENEWLFLHRIDSVDSGVHLRGSNGWEEVARITAQRV